jgi:hypothetical protein
MEDQKLIDDRLVITVFDEDTIEIRIINTDTYNKLKYYGVCIN